MLGILICAAFVSRIQSSGGKGGGGGGGGGGGDTPLHKPYRYWMKLGGIILRHEGQGN